MRLQLALRRFQVLPQLAELGFQFAPPLGDLSRVLLGAFPAFGFLGQRVRQSLRCLLHFRLGCLQFPGPRFEPGLFGKGTLLLR